MNQHDKNHQEFIDKLARALLATLNVTPNDEKPNNPLEQNSSFDKKV